MWLLWLQIIDYGVISQDNWYQRELYCMKNTLRSFLLILFIKEFWTYGLGPHTSFVIKLCLAC